MVQMLRHLVLLSLLASAAAQGPGSQEEEGGPDITLKVCRTKGSCQKKKLKLSMDSNWRWTHMKGDYKNCYDGNEWTDVGDGSCTSGDGRACATQCVLEGISSANYETKYGVSSTRNGDGVSMKFYNEYTVDNYSGTSVGARLYMYSGNEYEMFTLVNQEFVFDADMSQLECGQNGAVYFIEMEKDGGMSKGGANTAGPKFGTGYCDAQCPHDIKYIDGEANVKGWAANPKDKSGNMGHGHYGACCNEMDIWEANSKSNAFTPHPCTKSGAGSTLPGLYRCEGTECGDNDKGERYKGVCDKDGCDFASWRMGGRTFYGRNGDTDDIKGGYPGKDVKYTVDTSQPLTQIQQFISHNGQDNGDLVEIRRVWKQNGKVIQNTDAPHIKGCIGYGNGLNDDICKSQNERFGDYNHFRHHGGIKEMGVSLKRGHVLAISLWDDVDVSMMWLDSWFPRTKNKKHPGVSRGPCAGGETSTPTYVRKNFGTAVVEYWNFGIGCLGCTTEGVDAGPPARKPEKSKKECPFGGDDSFDDDNDNDNDDKSDTRRRSTRRRSPPSDNNDDEEPETRRRSPAADTRRRSPPKTRRRSP